VNYLSIIKSSARIFSYSCVNASNYIWASYIIDKNIDIPATSIPYFIYMAKIPCATELVVYSNNTINNVYACFNGVRELCCKPPPVPPPPRPIIRKPPLPTPRPPTRLPPRPPPYPSIPRPPPYPLRRIG
jgi:hypothetical protein